MFHDDCSLSRSTGSAPQYVIALAVATKVSVDVTTRSPGSTPTTFSAQMQRRRAATQRHRMRGTCVLSDVGFKASTSGPTGATQPESKARSRYSRSRCPTSGGDK